MLGVGAGTREVRFFDGGSPEAVGHSPCLADRDGRPITNLYAYDPEGRLLDPVLLYDDAGRPIDNLCPEYDSRGRRLVTEYRRDANGAPVIHAFPRAQTVLPEGEGFAPADPAEPFGPWPSTTVLGEAGTQGAGQPVAPPAVVVPSLAPPASAPEAPPPLEAPVETPPEAPPPG